MLRKQTFEEAYEWARYRAQATGADYRIVEEGGKFVASTIKRIEFFYPNALGWNVRYQY